MSGSKSLPTFARVRRSRPVSHPVPAPAGPPSAEELRRLRMQFSADLVHALRQVEGLERLTLDDLEWADAIATAMVAQTARRASRDQSGCASTATTPRRSPSTAWRAVARNGASATSAT